MILSTPGGCDSLVITTTTLLPSNTVNLTATTCNPLLVGIDTVPLFNQFGCDSLVITTTTLLPSNTVNLTATTCNPLLVGIDTVPLFNQFGCDSLVITTTTLLPSNTVNLTATTCNPLLVGIDTVPLFNQFGCDSLVITTTTLLPSNTVNLTATTCNPLLVGIDTVPLFNQFGCDSLVITTTTLLPSNTVNLTATTCNPLLVGIDTVPLFNQFGCDSLVITTTTLLPSNTVNLTATTCNPLLVGIDTVPLFNQFGCDSLVITTTTLLPGNTVNLTATTCNPLLVGIDTVPLFNQFGCDSLVITTTTLFANCTTNVACAVSSTNVTCNGLDNGTASASVILGTPPFNYAWSNGDTTAIITGLAPGTYTVLITDGIGETGSCTATISEPSSQISISALPTHILCFGDATGMIDITVNGGNPSYSYLWSNNSTIEDQSSLVAGTYTVTVVDAGGCSASASINIIENPVLVIGKQVTNVSCFGSSDGVAVVSVSGGIPSYTYEWNTTPIQTNFIATGLSAGTATVTIIDNAGCITSASINVTQPSAIDASVIVTDVSCNGANDGSVTVNPIGGTPYLSGSAYDYLWNTIPAQTTQTATGLSGGFYTVVISDSIWCTKTVVVSVSEPDVLTASINVFNVTCNGGSNGKGTAIPSGGTAPYTYLWSDNQTTQVATSLSAGTYSVIITDANNCTAVSSMSLTQPAPISVGALIGNVSCGGANDGKISLAVTGGTSPYSFQWNTNPVLTTSLISNLTAGSYSVVITDANGCQYFDTYVISDPNPLNPVYVVNEVSCNNGNDGSILITQFTGGVSPYNILWSNGNSTMNNAALIAGTYYLTVTDSLGCVHFDTILVSEPDEILCNSIINDATCNSSLTGSILTAVTGGTAPYTYSWTGGSTASNLLNIGAGTYTLLVTDALGCTKSEIYTVNEPAILTLSNSITNVSCNGGSDGMVTANPGGGTSPYTYSWSNGQQTQTANGLIAGVYTLFIIDANGCVKVSNVTITEPPLLLVSCTSLNSNCSGANDGTITASVSGGSPGYTYLWNSIPVQTTQTAINLPPGTYTVTVTDQNNCTGTSVCSIAQAGQLVCSTTSTNVTCHGASNGTATANGTGGTAPYSYTWLTQPVQNTQTVIGLSAGTYQVIVSDAVGCSDTCDVVIVDPPLLEALYVPVNPNCPGSTDGSIDVTIVGGTPPYSYMWSNGATTKNLTGIGAGLYTLTVTDNHNCFYVAIIAIIEPPVLACTITTMNESCGGALDGSATAAASGGTGPYTFLWSNGSTFNSINNISAGNYQLTITDNNGCTSTCIANVSSPPVLSCNISVLNGIICYGDATGNIQANIIGGTAPYTITWNTSPVQTTAIASGLTAGTYTATIYDANGCSTSCSVTLSEPADLTCSTTCTHVNCNGGSDGTAFVAAAGGVGPYTYSWNTIPAQSTQLATGLSVGFYTATIADANGCTTTCTIEIVQPPALLVGLNVSDISCNGLNDGSATATVVGGTAPYNYLWSNGSTLATASGLSAGSHFLTVTDAHNCVINILVMIAEPNPIGCSIINTPVTCNGGNDGAATVSAVGGLQPFTYVWSTLPVQNTITATGLVAGTYTVTVTDAFGCSSTCTTTIIEPAALVCSTAVIQNINCNNNTNGVAQAFASGGSGPYVFAWNTNPIQTTALATNLPAGTHIVTITDAIGCTVQCDVTISEPGELLCSINNLVLNCANDTGSLTVAVNGGTQPYTYIWNTNPVQTAATASGIGAGSYTVVVSDAAGCSTACSIVVQNVSPINATTSSTPENCAGASNGTASVNSVNGGLPPYTYLWNTSPVQTNPIATGLVSGSYDVVITDVNGCSITKTIIVGTPLSFGVTITNVQNVSCNQGNDASATALPLGGNAPFTYLWTGGQTNPTAILLSAGTYTVTATDFNGCSATASVLITEPDPISCVPTVTDASCFGASDGSIVLNNVSGGVAPYTFTWNSSPVQTTSSLTNVPHGTYTVIITDANGCTVQKQATIFEPSQIVCSISSTSANCGANNGTATVSAVGGSGSYTYMWNSVPAQNTATAVNLAPGLYTVVITDSKQCTSSCSVLVNGTNAITCTSTTINASCFGSTDGSITITSVSGGVAPYTYSWNTTPVQHGSTISGLAAGTYTVVINSADGCSGVKSIVVLQPNPVLSPIVNSNSPICAGDNIMLTGSAGYSTYNWSGPNGFNSNQPNPIFTSTVLANGLYTLFVTDANGCTASASTFVNVSSCVNVGDVAWMDLNGNGFQDIGEPGIGGVTVTLFDAATNSPTAFTAITDSLGNYLFTDVPSGNYYAVFSDVPGFAFTTNVFGGSQVTGNNGPGSTNDFIVANNDVLTIDAGYIGVGTIGDYVWEDLNGNGLQDDGNTGIAGVVVQLTWYGPDGISGTTDDLILTDTTDSTGAYTFNNLPPGSFEVMVLDGASTVLNGLSNTTGGNTTTVTLSPGNMNNLDQDFGYQNNVNVGDQVWVDLNGNGLFDSGEPVIQGVNVNLYTSAGIPAGTATTDANGYYLFTNVSPGDYYVVFDSVPGYNFTVFNAAGSQVTGANGPGSTGTFTVATADVLTIDQGYLGNGVIGDYVWEDLNGNGLQDDGNTGIAGVVVQLTWYGPDGISGTTDDLILTDTTDSTGAYAFNNLPPGSFEVMVLDGASTVLNGLSNTTGGNTTTVTLSPGNMNNLDQDFGYQNNVNVGDQVWVDLNGNGLFDSGEPVIQGVNVNLYTSAGIPAGTATTDANGYYLFTNVSPGDYYVVFDSVPGYNFTVFNAAGSQVTGANGQGSTGTFTVATADVLTIDQGYLGNGVIGDYVWEDLNGNGLQDDGNTGIAGVMVTLTWLGPDGVPSIDDVVYSTLTDSSGGYLFNGLPPGNYSVMVTDGAGSVLQNYNQTGGTNPVNNIVLTPVAMTDLTIDFGYQLNCIPAAITIQPANVLCNGDSTGSAIVIISAGTAPFTFSWSNGATTQNLINVPSGIYTITVNSTGGCSVTTSVYIGQNPPLSCVIADTICTIDFDLSVLQAGEIVTEQFSNLGIHISGTGNQNLPNAVIVFDSNDSTQVHDPDLQVGLGNLLILPTDVIDANNDSLVDNPDDSQYGGTMTFLFDNPVDINSLVIVDQDDSNLPIINAYDSLNNLITSVTVPQMGDMSVQTIFLNASNVSKLEFISFASVAIGPIDISCNGGSHSATVNPTGGVSPYTYSWNTSPNQTTQTISGIGPGTYIATVTDFYGCTTSCSIVIDTPCPKIAINTKTYNGGRNLSCNQSGDGAIITLVDGGTAPYNYQWSTGQTTSDLSSLSAGTYVLNVSDNSGCQVTKSVEITEPAPISCAVDAITNVGCNGGSDGSIAINVSGGNGPYVSSWNTNPTSTGLTLNNIPAGSYTLTVADTNGCLDVSTYQVTQPRALAAWTKWVAPTCHGDANGSINLFVRKGTAPYTYLWNDGATTQDRSGLVAGRYTVSVTDANGCRKKQSRYIVQPGKLKNIAHVTKVSCWGGNDGSIDLTIRGGVPPYTYLWADGTTTSNRTNLVKGKYPVTVTDKNGCTVYKIVSVNQPKFLFVNVATQNVTTQGGNDGTATEVVSGGTAPYSYLWSTGSTDASISGLVAGSYKLTVFDANGCRKVRRFTITEPVASGPLACNAVGSTIPCGASSGTTSVTVTGGFPPYNYFWNTNPAQTTATASGLSPGTYLVQVTDIRGSSSAVFCFATVSCTNAKTVSPIAINEKSVLSVYPNPFTNDINLNVLSVFDDEKFDVQVIDMLGKSVYMTTINTLRGISSHKITLTNLPEGIYFVKLKSNHSSFVERVIKQ